MRRFTAFTSALLMAAGILAAAPVAMAASIYEHRDYSGAAQGGENVNKLGTMNDKTSSIRVYGKTVTFYEHAYLSGNALRLWSDASNLREYQYPFAPTLSWNDRISSWYTP